MAELAPQAHWFELVEHFAQNRTQLADAVRATDACDDLELSEAQIDSIAFALLDYQLYASLAPDLRQSYQQKNQRAAISRARDSFEQAADQIEALLCNPALCVPALLGYVRPDPVLCEPTDILSNRQLAVDADLQLRLAPTETTHPDNPHQALLEARDRLRAMARALADLGLRDKSDPIVGWRGASNIDIVRRLADLLPEHTRHHKATQADYIREFLALIRLKLSTKSIRNMLSQI